MRIFHPSDSIKKYLFLPIIIRSFSFLFCTLFFVTSSAQRSALKVQHSGFKTRHITGLSQSTVNCVFQDSRGFMWFGTQDGLNRYDGSKKMIVYNSDLENKQSLSGNTITAIIEDSEKKLWIGSKNNGISIYIPQIDKFKRFVYNEQDKNTISDNSIKDLFYDSDNIIWVATSNGLNSIDPKTLEVKRYFIEPDKKPEIVSNEIYLVVENPFDKQLFVATSSGIYKFNKKKSVFVPVLIPGLKNMSLVNAVFDKSHWIYITTQESKTIVLDINSGSIVENNVLELPEFHKSRESFQIACAYRTSEGISYLGTDRKGVLVINEKRKRVEIINSDPGSGNLLSDKIRCIYFDQYGYMWVGSDLGADYIQSGKLKFKTITIQDFEKGALQSHDIMSVLVDGNKIFLGTSNKGLNVVDQSTGKAVELPKGIEYGSEQGVLSLLKDSEGNYWIGTWGGGLVKLNMQKKSYKQFKGANSTLGGQNITCLAENNKNIWIGTLEDGLYKLDKGEEAFSKFTMNNGLSANSIYYVGFDPEKKLWIGTNGGGLNIFDPKTNKVQVYKHEESNKNSLSSDIVNCVYLDKNKNAWIATDNGLNKFDIANNAFTRYYKKDGLPNNYIYSILPDNNGNLWMSTNEGLSKFDPNNENVEGSAFTNYGLDDGLQGGEFNQGAFYKGKNGQLYFGGLNGLSVFNPDKLTSSSHIPPVHITSYKRFNKEVLLDTSISFKKYIEVSYKENSLAFEFIALDFNDPGRNKYSWKMEGLETEWKPPINRNFAEYPSLPPGDYTFRVKASNSDGVWNNTGTYIYITVRPPWYKTSLAYFLFVFTALFVAWGYSQYKTSQVARQKRVLERMVEQRTVQLAEKNRDITSSIEYARKIQDAILPPVNDIYRAFPESFILYKPRDIVSGDFYWFYEKGNKKVIAVVDCTGHGVPGAFMSMIGHNLLNQIVIENGITEAAEILNQLHKGVQSALKQGNAGVESKDGMDVSLCVFDSQNAGLQYAGAYRTLYLLSNADPSTIKKISGDKFPIGGSHFGLDRSFSQNNLALNKGDMIYMFTDGFADQFGGENGKKFMVKRFSEMLLKQWRLPVNEQREKLEEAFNTWKGPNDQVDDVLVIGIRA